MSGFFVEKDAADKFFEEVSTISGQSSESFAEAGRRYDGKPYTSVVGTLRRTRSSTFIPNMICEATWLPFRFSKWLVRVLWSFCRFILAGWFIAVGLTALANIFGARGADAKMFVVILIAVTVGGAVLFSDWLTR